MCSSCGAIVTALACEKPKDHWFHVDAIFPAAKNAAEEIPATARNFLQQAFNTIGSPDAAAVMAGSGVDAMLKHLGYVEGTLYQRIDQALAANILTTGMADWAHSVRLGSNRPRHADADRPHVTSEEAQQSVEFAEALGSFLFVLSAKIQKGIAAAQPRSAPKA